MRNLHLKVIIILIFGFESLDCFGMCATRLGDLSPDSSSVERGLRDFPRYWQKAAGSFNFKNKHSERKALDMAKGSVETGQWEQAARWFHEAGLTEKAEMWKKNADILNGDVDAKPLMKTALKKEKEGKCLEAARDFTTLKDYEAAARNYINAAENQTGTRRLTSYRKAAELLKDYDPLGSADIYMAMKMWPEAIDLYKELGDAEGIALSKRQLALEWARGHGEEKQKGLNLLAEAKKELRKVAKEHIRNGRYQEAVWTYQNAGEVGKADKLSEQIKTSLLKMTETDILTATSLGGGGNVNFLVEFRNRMKVVFRPGPSKMSEVAVRIVDSRMGLNLVPITARRANVGGQGTPLNGLEGSLQLYVHDGRMPRDGVLSSEDHWGDLKWFDLLVGIEDRHDDNLFIRYGQPIGFDHEKALRFRNFPEYADDKDNIVGSTPASREFYESLRALDVDELINDLEGFPRIDVKQLRKTRESILKDLEKTFNKP